MNISEAAKLANLSSKSIRDYEDKGLITAPKRTENGYRVYSQDNIQELQFIQQARQVGFSLAEIETLLNFWRLENRHSSDVKAVVLEHMARLEKQIADLQNMHSKLSDWANSCHGDERSECSILNQLSGKKTRCHTID